MKASIKFEEKKWVLGYFRVEVTANSKALVCFLQCSEGTLAPFQSTKFKGCVAFEPAFSKHKRILFNKHMLSVYSVREPQGLKKSIEKNNLQA